MTTERYLVVHTASSDGISRPYLVPVTGLSVSVGMGGLGVVTWPGGTLGVLEKASDLVRAIGAGGNDAAWELVVAQFVDAEGRVSTAARSMLGGVPGVPGLPPSSRSGMPGMSELLPSTATVPVTLPGAHGGRPPEERP